jgi:hypothetical protein
LTTERKKNIMINIRKVAYHRAKTGFLEILQKGKVIPDPSDDTVRGPIRLRLKAKTEDNAGNDM